MFCRKEFGSEYTGGVGEKWMAVTSNTYSGGGPVVLHLPGVGADGWALSTPDQLVDVELLAGAGCVVFSSTFADVPDGDGGSSWGNLPGRNRMDAALTYLADRYDADVSRVALLCNSEGGDLGLNWGWRHTEVCKAIVTRLTPPNVQSLYDANGLVADLIDAAFDDLGGWPANREAHDPSSATNLPLVEAIADRVLMFYSTDDGLAPEADHRTFADETGVTVRSLGPIMHDLTLTRIPFEWEAGWILDRLAI